MLIQDTADQGLFYTSRRKNIW